MQDYLDYEGTGTCWTRNSVRRGRLAKPSIQVDSVGNQSFGYMDEDEKLPAYITNWYKDPFEVSIDAED